MEYQGEETMQILPYTSVQNMLPGDRFMTNRSGMVTVRSVPEPDGLTGQRMDNLATYTVWVEKEDGSMLHLIGINRYRVERNDWPEDYPYVVQTTYKGRVTAVRFRSKPYADLLASLLTDCESMRRFVLNTATQRYDEVSYFA